ncbi:cupin domain-containing protein [Roseateles koreensis]|uniref:Cupin domain-containing protein n=1 Tax=Roseateles koreensis TaxID=2987526 RepID=A0ABT5KXH5_9BURK|nr:cupin domain-containing protein [Roseateles koreensis]MDC8786457.1 cupin domain-containing protein [Roseateles koreensis]
MAQQHLASGCPTPVLPLGAALKNTPTHALLKAQQLEVIRIVLLAGKTMREHQAPGEMTLLCVEGHLELSTPQGTRALKPGDLLHLDAQVPHALRALEDSSALLTLVLHKV